MIRLFFAHFLRIWLWSGTVAFVVWTIRQLDPGLAMIREWREVLRFLYLIALSIPLGFLLAVMGLWILGPMVWHTWVWWVGGELRVGEHVRILVGRHKGVVTIVQSLGQGTEVSVALGDAARRDGSGHFSQLELERVDPYGHPIELGPFRKG